MFRPVNRAQNAGQIDTHMTPRIYTIERMNTRPGLALIVFVIWSVVNTGFMLLNRVLDLEVFFVLLLIGLLVVVELIDPISVQPRSMRRLKYIVAIGVIIFGSIVARRAMEILGI